MSRLQRWAKPADLVAPQDCRVHPGVAERVLMACNDPRCGREVVWLEPSCPRCAFVDSAEMFFAAAAVWDGSRWRDDEVGPRFRALWLEQARAEGLVANDLSDDVLADPGGDGLDGLWELRVLHPELSRERALAMLASTSIDRRPGWAPQGYELAPVPYTDIDELQRLSDGLIRRWSDYHSALVSVLDRRDVERARVTGYRDMRNHSVFPAWTEPGAMPATVYTGEYEGFASRLVAAHERVIGELGVERLGHRDRWQVYGDQYGDPPLDIVLGLNMWLNREPAWMWDVLQ